MSERACEVHTLGAVSWCSDCARWQDDEDEPVATSPQGTTPGPGGTTE